MSLVDIRRERDCSCIPESAPVAPIYHAAQLEHDTNLNVFDIDNWRLDTFQTGPRICTFGMVRCIGSFAWCAAMYRNEDLAGHLCYVDKNIKILDLNAADAANRISTTSQTDSGIHSVLERESKSCCILPEARPLSVSEIGSVFPDCFLEYSIDRLRRASLVTRQSMTDPRVHMLITTTLSKRGLLLFVHKRTGDTRPAALVAQSSYQAAQ